MDTNYCQKQKSVSSIINIMDEGKPTIFNYNLQNVFQKETHKLHQHCMGFPSVRRINL